MNIPQKFSLEDLSKSSYPVVWDACAFSLPLGENEKERLKDMTEFNQQRNVFLAEFKRVLPQSRFYVPKKIMDEISVYYNRLKGITLPEHMPRVRKFVLKLRREMEKGRKLTTGISYLLEEKSRILDLTNHGLYTALHDYYEYFKNKFGLSEEDLDFLVSGLCLAKKDGCASMVSNDFGIARARSELIQRGEISSGDFPFYIKRDFFNFEEVSRAQFIEHMKSAVQ